MNRFDSITVVGGGTSGLISALILKNRFPILNIKIIKSDKLGIIGVGEGSTEHFSQFMSLCNITENELYRECDATVKRGVMFEGWTKENYYHCIPTIYVKHLLIGQYQLGYAHHIVNKEPQIESTDQNFKTNTIFKYDSDNNINVTSQYHFNTFKLNDFLQKKLKELGVEIIDDEITDVIIENNNISKIKGTKQSYTSDLFIDCTGFKRLLISKLGAEWKSFKEHLTMNEAIAFQTEDTDNYNTYTLAKAMDFGWMWRIPVYGRWGNGYVFNNNYITAEQAQSEVEKVLKKKIKVTKNVRFDPGALDKVWIGNCVAIGLSANFVEPLEASSIGTSIQQTFLLMHYLGNNVQKDIDTYNKKVLDIMYNIRDFIFLHYMVNKNNTNFWKDIQKIKPPKSLKEKLDVWKYRLPIEEDFLETRYFVFFHQNFLNVLYGLNMFDYESIKNEYNKYSGISHQYVEEVILNHKKIYNEEQITHKEFLNIKRSI